MQARTAVLHELNWEQAEPRRCRPSDRRAIPCNQRLRTLGEHLQAGTRPVGLPACSPVPPTRPYPRERRRACIAARYQPTAQACASSPYVSAAAVAVAAGFGAVVGWILGRRHGFRQAALLASQYDETARAAVAAEMKNKAARWVRCCPFSRQLLVVIVIIWCLIHRRKLASS